MAELFTLLAVIVVLYRAAAGDTATAGSIFAVLSYALRIQGTLDEVPAFVQQIGRLVDIRRRIQTVY